MLYRKQARHTHLVHGGPSEYDSYGRKKKLNFADIIFVAVSDYARERLIANGVRLQKICVIENFLPQNYIETVPRRPKFIARGIQNVAVVTRIDPSKRVDVLLDALDLAPELSRLRFRVFGGGASSALIERAKKDHPNLTFEGYCNNVAGVLTQSDLLLHTCPSESFGLVILEGMAAGIPVLVPDKGGAAAVVEPGRTGWHFKANDHRSLANQLTWLMNVQPDTMNEIVASTDHLLRDRYSSRRGIEEYRRLFMIG